MKVRKIPFIFIIALLYFIFSFTLIYLKWKAHTPSLDYHAYVQMYWNTANGDIMQYNRGSEAQYSLFSAHFAPFLLLIFPFYLVVKHVLTLYFVWLFIISLSVIPLYFFSLDKLKSKLSAYLISLSFLVYFPFLWTHYHGFAEESLATPLLFFAFLFLDRKKPWLYLIFSILTLSLRINMMLPVFLLGLYAIFKNKARSQGIFICLLSVFWLYFILNVIYPKYTDPGNRFYIYGFFGGYGNNPKEVIINMISHPSNLISTFISKQKLVFDLFGPVLFLPFLAPGILLIGLPILVVNMLASYPRLSNSWTYYQSSSLPFIWLALVVTLERIGRLWEFLIKKFKLKLNLKKDIVVNFFIFIILVTNLIIDIYSPNGQYLLFSSFFNLRKYETNFRDNLAHKILYSIPKTNSVATQHSYLEHTAERKWQFPNENFSGYAVDILLLDTWASSLDFKPVLADEPYTKILDDSFFFLYARNDLVKEYSIKEFTETAYKNYNKDFEYLVTSKPEFNYTSYSGIESSLDIEISDRYELAQKLDIEKENPRTLVIPLEKSHISGPNDLLKFYKKRVSNLKVEILEGADFNTDAKIVYSKIYASDKINHKTTTLYANLSDIKFDSSKVYWLKLSLDRNKKKESEIFNKFTIHLTDSKKQMETDVSNIPGNLYYSLDGGKEWRLDSYPGKDFAYSIIYGKFGNRTFIGKGTPANLKTQLEKLLKNNSDYKLVVVVGSITEKL